MVDFGDKISCTVFTYGCNMRCPFCHNGALVVGDGDGEVLEDEIFDYLKKRKGLVDAVCVTGGESTLQKDLPEFLKKVRELGYIIKVDSNGLDPEMLETLIDRDLVDYLAMDIKNSLEKYPLTTGLKKVDLKKIRRSIELLMTRAKDYEFRTTVIKEFHTKEDMQNIAELLCGAKKYVLQKYVDSEGCISHGFTAYEKPEAEELLKLFEGKVDNLLLRGY